MSWKERLKKLPSFADAGDGEISIDYVELEAFIETERKEAVREYDTELRKNMHYYPGEAYKFKIYETNRTEALKKRGIE